MRLENLQANAPNDNTKVWPSVVRMDNLQASVLKDNFDYREDVETWTSLVIDNTRKLFHSGT